MTFKTQCFAFSRSKYFIKYQCRFNVTEEPLKHILSDSSMVCIAERHFGQCDTDLPNSSVACHCVCVLWFEREPP
jgi:hypothetical protein